MSGDRMAAVVEVIDDGDDHAEGIVCYRLDFTSEVAPSMGLPATLTEWGEWASEPTTDGL